MFVLKHMMKDGARVAVDSLNLENIGKKKEKVEMIKGENKGGMGIIDKKMAFEFFNMPGLSREYIGYLAGSDSNRYVSLAEELEKKLMR